MKVSQCLELLDISVNLVDTSTVEFLPFGCILSLTWGASFRPGNITMKQRYLQLKVGIAWNNELTLCRELPTDQLVKDVH